MRTWMKTIALAVSFVFAGGIFAAGGHGGHGAKAELGEQKTESWTVVANQFGSLKGDASQLVFTVILSANSNASIDDIEALRVWFGDIDSDSLVTKLDGFESDGKLLFHSHLPVEDGDDYSQFTMEIDTGSDEGEILSFKTQ